MVYFMREAKGVDDVPRKEASGKEREGVRERERHSLELRAQDNFVLLHSC
jgi:hypothetical protein